MLLSALYKHWFQNVSPYNMFIVLNKKPFKKLLARLLGLICKNRKKDLCYLHHICHIDVFCSGYRLFLVFVPSFMCKYDAYFI
jgi:hypothetical protein